MSKRKNEASESDGEEDECEFVVPKFLQERFAPNHMSHMVSQQKERAPAANEFQVSAVFSHYEVSREVDGKKSNVHLSEVPKRVTKEVKFTDKDGKEEKRNIPERLVMRSRFQHGTEVEGSAVLTANGDYKVFATLGFHPDAVEWFKEIHADPSLYKGKSPISEYMNAEGHLAENRWIVLRKNQLYKMKVGDFGPMVPTEKDMPNVFRQRTEDGLPLVSKHVQLKFNKCQVSQYVVVREIEKGVKEPTAYTSIDCKGSVRLLQDHDPYKPLSERYHTQEDKDEHRLVPVKKLAANDGRGIANNPYFYFKSPGYQTPVPSMQGITWKSAVVDDMRDFLYVTKDGESFPKITIRGMLVQWHDNPQEDKCSETYSLNMITRGEQWRESGITDAEHFARIFMANPVWVHAECKPWTSSILKSEANQPIIKGVTDKNLRDDPTLEWMQTGGYMTLEMESVVFDYGRYLPVMGLHVSKEWVEKEFSKFIAKMGQGEDERKALYMTPPDKTKTNPLHQGSPYILSLGNSMPMNPKDKKSPPRCHGYLGDVFEVIDDDYTFFVLTSHTLSVQERREFCGRKKETQHVEPFLEKLKQEENIFYWVFAYNNKASAYVPLKKKKINPTPVVEEEEDDGSPQAMDELPDEEIKHEEAEPEPEDEDSVAPAPAPAEQEQEQEQEEHVSNMEIEEEDEDPVSEKEEEESTPTAEQEPKEEEDDMEIVEEDENDSSAPVEQEEEEEEEEEEEPEEMEIEEEMQIEEEKEPSPPPSPPKKVRAKKKKTVVTKKKVQKK